MEAIREKLEIDKTRLDEELSRQAANYLYIAEKSVNAEMQYESFKAQVAQLEAHIDMKIRSEMADKKKSEATIRAEIECTESYIKASKTLLELRGQREVMKAHSMAWHMRKDCLIQLAIKARSEMDSMLSETVKRAVA